VDDPDAQKVITAAGLSATLYIAMYAADGKRFEGNVAGAQVFRVIWNTPAGPT
jgi:hypothetical protein